MLIDWQRMMHSDTPWRHCSYGGGHPRIGAASGILEGNVLHDAVAHFSYSKSRDPLNLAFVCHCVDQELPGARVDVCTILEHAVRNSVYDWFPISSSSLLVT